MILWEQSFSILKNKLPVLWLYFQNGGLVLFSLPPQFYNFRIGGATCDNLRNFQKLRIRHARPLNAARDDDNTMNVFREWLSNCYPRASPLSMKAGFFTPCGCSGQLLTLDMAGGHVTRASAFQAYPGHITPSYYALAPSKSVLIVHTSIWGEYLLGFWHCG